MIENFNHGDLHPGNWRVRIEEEKCKIVIYDYGFCWKQNQSQFEEMGDLMTDTFGSSNRQTNDVSLDNLCKIIYYAVVYNGEDKENEYKGAIPKAKSRYTSLSRSLPKNKNKDGKVNDYFHMSVKIGLA